MELPLFTEAGRGEDTYEAYQSIHGKPRMGGEIAGLVFLIELKFLKGRNRLTKYPVTALIEY
jgi:adenine/guanine phosphoribosyltransferase-like PRPP-binding protein